MVKSTIYERGLSCSLFIAVNKPISDIELDSKVLTNYTRNQIYENSTLISDSLNINNWRND